MLDLSTSMATEISCRSYIQTGIACHVHPLQNILTSADADNIDINPSIVLLENSCHDTRMSLYHHIWKDVQFCKVLPKRLLNLPSAVLRFSKLDVPVERALSIDLCSFPRGTRMFQTSLVNSSVKALLGTSFHSPPIMLFGC